MTYWQGFKTYVDAELVRQRWAWFLIAWYELAIIAGLAIYIKTLC